MSVGNQTCELELPAPGLHYSVDATIAVGTLAALLGAEVKVEAVTDAMREGTPVYGRGETITYKGQDFELTMMKNLPSLQANLDAMVDSPALVWVAVDEGTPDPSWLYDVDLGVIDHVDVLSGTKAWQWALFLEHRGIPYGDVIEDTAQALDHLQGLSLERDVAVSAIVNYEQMMLIRRLAGYKELEGAA